MTMSVMVLERGVPADSAARDVMPGGIAASALMHLGMALTRRRREQSGR
jgi:hypothetical protein